MTQSAASAHPLVQGAEIGTTPVTIPPPSIPGERGLKQAGNAELDTLEVYTDACSPNSYSVYDPQTGGFHRILMRDGQPSESSRYGQVVVAALLGQRPLYALPSYLRTDKGLFTCEYFDFGFTYSVSFNSGFLGFITRRDGQWEARSDRWGATTNNSARVLGTAEHWQQALDLFLPTIEAQERQEQRHQQLNRSMLARFGL